MLDEKILPMLAYSSDPFDSPEHIFEIKWDGTRCMLFLKGKELRLQNRRLVDITPRYPELQGIRKDLKARNAILDGELVVLSEGVPDFGKLQVREHSASPLKVRLLSKELPATFIAFDILYYNGRPCTGSPLMERKELLRKVMEETPRIVESRYIREKGKAFFLETVKKGFEGVMGKKISSPYLIGKRSRYWLKVKPRNVRTCIVAGFTAGKGGRTALFGALAVVTEEKGRLTYRGRVGSGFSDAELADISRRLERLKTNNPPSPELAKIRGVRWVRPVLKCEVIYQEETGRGHFRAPVFRRLIA